MKPASVVTTIRLTGTAKPLASDGAFPLVLRRVIGGSISPATQSATVKADIVEIRRAWKLYQNSSRRTGVFLFLAAVFRAVQRWRRTGHVERNCRLALKQLINPANMKLESFTILLHSGSDPDFLDQKIRSKLSRALRAVERLKPKGESVAEYIKRNGGINACAALWKHERDN
jgi:hypothetical protein